MLEALGRVFYYDAQARQQNLSAQERLLFHQQHSAPVMEQLHGWLQVQLAQNKTEPNSALGKAINYMLRHWRALTVFLRQPGAPLDNNLCHAASGMADVMPTSGLCRVDGLSKLPVLFLMAADAA